MRELIEPMSTMRPPLPPAIIARPAARAHQNVPVRLTSIDASPGVVVERVGRSADLDPGARDEHVDAAVLGDDPGDQLVARRGIGDVEARR